MGAAAEGARGGQGPTLIEALTYRQCGHSKSDECLYRTDEEEREWAERDPILRLAARLLDEDTATEGEFEEIAAAVEEEIGAAVQFARESPDPDPATVTERVFSDFDGLL